MNQLLSKIKQYKKWILIAVVVIFLLCFHQWLLESIWIDGTYTNNISTKRETSKQLRPKQWYTQSFYCTGPRLRKLYLYFANCTDDMGKIVVELRDEDGKKIKKKTRKIVPSTAGDYTFTLNVYENLEIGKKYVIKVKYMPVADEIGPSLKCYTTYSTLLNMRTKGEKSGTCMRIQYYYNKRVSMVAWISIMVLLVLSFVFARYKRNIKVNYYVFSEILLLFGSMGVYLLIESINDSIQYVTWNGVLSNVIPFPVAKGYEFKRYCYIL